MRTSVLKILDRLKVSRKISIENLVGKTDGVTAVFLSLLDYLQEMELAEQRRRKYLEEHPEKVGVCWKGDSKSAVCRQNSIKVFDMKQEGAALDSIGAALFLARRTGEEADLGERV